jgi:methyl-branched lipid omega-hydroxylase
MNASDTVRAQSHRVYRPTELHVDEINLASNDTFMRPDIEGIFEKLRREKPVSWHQHPDSGLQGFWAVVRFDDICAVNRDFATFSNQQGIQVLIENDQPRAGKGSLIEMDPPQHTRYRKIVAGAFSSMAVKKLESQVRARVARTLDAIGDRKEFDFVEEYATPIPLGLIYDLLGVPEADHHHILSLADKLFFSADPRHGGDAKAMQSAGIELQAYGRELAERKRREPGDDLMSAVALAEVDGERLTVPEIGSFFGLLGGAGADTSRATLVWAMEALTIFDDQRRRWLEDLDGQAGKAVEELFRWSTPTMHMRRTAIRDATIAGQAVREGDKVALWWMSGNRDAAKFPDPYQLDLARGPNPIMTFGMAGPHFCLGAHLARLEIQVALVELLRRFPNIHATGPARRLRSNFINGPYEMPVSV